MKTQTLFGMFCLLFNVFYVGAQLGMQVVNDPGANAKLTESLVTAQKSVQEAEKTVTLLEEAESTLSKVNNAIMSVDEVKDIITIQKEITDQIIKNTKTLQKASDFLKPEELSDISKSYNELLERTTSLVTQSNKLLSNDLFKMSDYERLSQLQYIKEGMIVQRANVNWIFDSYISIARTRAINGYKKNPN